MIAMFQIICKQRQLYGLSCNFIMIIEIHSDESRVKRLSRVNVDY